MKTVANVRYWLGGMLVVLLCLAVGSQFDFGAGKKSLVSPNSKKVAKPFSEKKKRVKGMARHDNPGKFAEFHRLIRTRDGESAPAYPKNYRIKELMQAKSVTSTRALAKRSAGIQALNWTERGPGNVSGRTRAIIVDPDDPNFDTWYAGSVGGGVWKTTNAGRAWTELTRDLPNLATSVLVMAESNHNIMYLGTGEGFGNTDQIDGSGIWKSTDRGQSWSQLAATANNDDFDNVTRMVVDPANPDIVVASTTPGFNLLTAQKAKIMRSVDGGATWSESFASNFDIEDLVVNPQNFKTQFASLNGNGIVKSIDGGKNWVNSSTGIGKVARLEIAVSPVDTSWIFLSCQGKDDVSTLYVSTDAGLNWVIGNDTGAEDIDWLGGQGWYDNAIAAHPYIKNQVFVGGINLWSIDVKPSVTTTTPDVTGIDYENTDSFMSFINFGGGLGNGGIDYGELPVSELVSVEMRFGPGISQKAHRFLVPAGETSGVPATDYAYQDYVDVPFQLWDVTNNQQLMVSFRDQSRNGVWELAEDNTTGREFAREYLFFQKIPYNATTPDPNVTQNGGHQYQQLFFLWPVLTGGGSFDPNNLPNATLRINYGSITARDMELTNITDGYGQFGGTSKGVHVDQHRIIAYPTNIANKELRFIAGNDGGVYYSDNEGTSFTHTLYGYNTTQFYGVDKMHGADRYLGGTQDNGSWFSPVNAGASSTWDDAPSGDGFEAVWHYDHPDSMLETSQFNNIFRTVDGGATWHSVDSESGMDDENGYPFISRLAKSNIDPDLVFATGGSGLWRTDDFATSWRLIPMPDGFVGANSFSQVEISQATPQVVWAGHYMGGSNHITPFVSRDGGLSFSATSEYTETRTGRITGIATHPADPATAYLLFSYAKGPKVLRTTDFGQNWEDISGFGTNSSSNNGFPDVATFDLICMPYNTNILWAGTEIGLFESTDGGASWHYADNGLPAVAIWQLRIVDDEIVVATHGRGVWSVELPELAGYTLPDIPRAPRLTSVGQRPTGETLVNYKLQSQFDSTHVIVDGAVAQSFGINAPGAFSAVIAAASEGQHAISILSFKDGLSYASPTDSVQILDVPAVKSSYVWDFNFNKPDFFYDGFKRFRGDAFNSFALHSDHPYNNATDHSARLRVPIKVDGTDDSFSYDDIAIIETGEDGTVFGEEEFYDFVVVEGSRDGINWLPLADGYDSRANAQWLAKYNTEPNSAPDPSLFVSHTIHLRDTFAAGEKIFIRFRLHADPLTNAWGWVVDNLVIQPNATSVAETDNLPQKYTLAQNYPNPFNPETIISYALPEKAEVSLVIYNVRGQRVRTLVQNKKQEAGIHKMKWNGLDDNGFSVSSGVYFYKLKTANFVKSRKMSLIR